MQWNLHAKLALLSVENEIEAARACLRHLAQHDVLRDAFDRIDFGMSCGLHQNVDSLFEGAAHQSAHLLSVDAVTSDRHEMSLRRHDIAEKSKMSIVDIRTVE